MKTAQQAIASNWIEVYKKYVGPEPETLGRPSEVERAETAPKAMPATHGPGRGEHEKWQILEAG